MPRHIVQRALSLVPIWFGVSILIFVLMRILPGDLAAVMLGDNATPEALQSWRHYLGLDKPILEQYVRWVAGVVQLDFGRSFYTDEPVLQELLVKAGPTLNLALAAMVITLLIGIPLGVLAALYQDRWIDYISRVVSIAGLAIPTFWLGAMLLLGLALVLHWSLPMDYVGPFSDPSQNLQKMVLPALVLGYAQAAIVARMTRSCMLEVLREDYVRTARSKGLMERVVVLRHALKNAVLPVVTVAGVIFAVMLSGTVVVEMVFTIPGVGRLLVDSIYRRDYPVIETTLLAIATVVVLVNLLTDLVYAWLDPRIAYR